MSEIRTPETRHASPIAEAEAEGDCGGWRSHLSAPGVNRMGPGRPDAARSGASEYCGYAESGVSAGAGYDRSVCTWLQCGTVARPRPDRARPGCPLPQLGCHSAVLPVASFAEVAWCDRRPAVALEGWAWVDWGAYLGPEADTASPSGLLERLDAPTEWIETCAVRVGAASLALMVSSRW